MDAIEQRVQPYGPTTAGRLRIMVVLAVLVVGLFAGFGLGRAGGDLQVAPAWSPPVAHWPGHAPQLHTPQLWPSPAVHGPGHVPRVWVDQP